MMDEDEELEAPAAPIDLPRLLRGVLQDLQSKPRHYRRWGVFWWPMKLLLKRQGYGPLQLYMLGDYQDPETAALVPAMDLDGTIRAAVDEYRFNATFPHADGRVESPDGDLVDIRDDDAGL